MPATKHHVIHASFLAGKHVFIYISIMILSMAIVPIFPPVATNASNCPDLKVIFARGSGAERYNNNDYQVFKSTLESKLKTSNLTYEFDDLDYPAIGVGADNLQVLIGAYFGGGDSYEFGGSVNQGANRLINIINNDTCINTKYVIAGYSQGALAVMKGLDSIIPEKLVYAATFGDPKIYLPEGKGAIPAACRGDNLSEYRIYVPDCRAYTGLLGAKTPYITPALSGKVGTWCNKFDIFCSSHFSISSHTSYDTDNLYEDASRLIFSKVAAEFNFKNAYTSPHDTAILIDSTGSMGDYIAKYKSEALRLATKTLDAGGRVALYDYRDLKDPYTPVKRCGFDTCTLETFKQGLNQIGASDGGEDEPESLLSASFHVMKNESWQLGSTKSLVILTDASYHSPDYDGTTFYDVKALSKQIDPVNFYIITTKSHLADYESLAKATDGAVVTTSSNLTLLTDTIMERYDSLPRVEESLKDEATPSLVIDSAEIISNSEATVSFTTDAKSTIVILNDAILGLTSDTTITIGDLNINFNNQITLVPLSSNTRGEPVTVELNAAPSFLAQTELITQKLIPKAPNTGRR
ncbi:cutinase family protein [Candidatus Saccharibacteria bacterium]|nr:cutinase family protein [Candidatus Saccharibacteria bacterium]